MRGIGARINESGVIFREGTAWLCRREAGGRFRLEYAELDDGLVGSRVTLVGTLVQSDVVAVKSLDLEA